MDEGHPGFQLLAEEEIAAEVIKDLLWNNNQIINYKNLQLRRNFLAPQEMALMQ
jgi:hypothetical protein